MIVTTKDELQKIVFDAVTAALREVPVGSDEWVDIKVAAKFLNVSEVWLYRQRKRLPFCKKVAPKMLRFSMRGMQKWLESRSV